MNPTDPRPDLPIRLATWLACAAPLFALTVRSWASGVLLFSTIAAGWLLLRVRSLPAPDVAGRWKTAMLVALAAPLAAAVLTGLLRRDLQWVHLDAPLRFVLAIPIFLLFLRRGSDAAAAVRVLAPLMLFTTLAFVLVVPAPERWGARLATHAADPLVLGYLSLASGLACLMAIDEREPLLRPSWTWVLLAGTATGLYLSMRSGSRTGWLALPVVLACWTYARWPRGGPRAVALACALPLVLMAAAYVLLPGVQFRVDHGIAEMRRYAWDGVATVHSSLGLRISFLRIAAELFTQHPWLGLGDTSRIPDAQVPAFAFATPDAVLVAFRAAFHNQVISNAVRMGLPGLLATLALLLVPLAIVVRAWRSGDGATRRTGRVGLAFLGTLVAASLTTEIVDLKSMASLYAVMAAVFCGTCLRKDAAPAAA